MHLERFGVRPCTQALDALAVDAEHVCGQEKRKRHCELLHDLNLSFAKATIEELADHLLDLLGSRRNRRRFETLRDHLPQPGVIGWIGANHAATLPRTRMIPRSQRAAIIGREGPVVAQDCRDIVVSRDEPSLVALAPGCGRALAQHPIRGVRILDERGSINRNRRERAALMSVSNRADRRGQRESHCGESSAHLNEVDVRP